MREKFFAAFIVLLAAAASATTVSLSASDTNLELEEEVRFTLTVEPSEPVGGVFVVYFREGEKRFKLERSFVSYPSPSQCIDCAGKVPLSSDYSATFTFKPERKGHYRAEANFGGERQVVDFTVGVQEETTTTTLPATTSIEESTSSVDAATTVQPTSTLPASTTLPAAKQDPIVCAVYFTGIGCPHCAKSDPYVLGELPVKFNGSLVVIEYEIYQKRDNAQVMLNYHTSLDMGHGIPKVILAGEVVGGDNEIEKRLEDEVVERLTAGGSDCPLPDGEVDFHELDLNSLGGFPSVWIADRVLVRGGPGSTTAPTLRKIALGDSIDDALPGGAESLEAGSEPLSGGRVDFARGALIGGWVARWNENTTGGGRVKITSIWYYMDLLVKALMVIAGVMLVIIVFKEIGGKRR